MELSPAGRIAAFVAAVLVLAGIGAFLFLPRSSAAGRDHGHAHAPSRSASPSPSESPPHAGAPDIYRWLPFSEAGLASAAAAATAFSKDYGSFSYRESTAAYLAPMRPLASSDLVGMIGRAFAAPGLAATRTSKKQVVAGSASVVSLRAFGPTSITFVVAITEQITQSGGSSQQRADYAVTVTGGGGSWQVSDIELASAGNQ
jgi:hypothetical protein